MNSLKGKVALVTGAGSGIGQAIAVRFAQEGAHMAIETHPGGKHSGLEVLGPIAQFDKDALAVPANVDNRAEVENMVAEIVKKFGPPRYLRKQRRHRNQKTVSRHHGRRMEQSAFGESLRRLSRQPDRRAANGEARRRR